MLWDLPLLWRLASRGERTAAEVRVSCVRRLSKLAMLADSGPSSDVALVRATWATWVPPCAAR